MKNVPVTAALLICLGMTGSAETRLGAALTIKESVAIATLTERPAQYAGKQVQVRGKVAEVCEMMGCWMNLVDPGSGQRIRIKVEDGKIVFPKQAVGRMAIAEGKVVQVELTREEAVEQARHEAEETGRRFDPSSVTGPVSYVQLEGTGAVLLD